MVTGDNLQTAKAIAEECGICTEGGIAIEGKTFRAMTIEQQYNVIPSIDVKTETLIFLQYYHSHLKSFLFLFFFFRVWNFAPFQKFGIFLSQIQWFFEIFCQNSDSFLKKIYQKIARFFVYHFK